MLYGLGLRLFPVPPECGGLFRVPMAVSGSRALLHRGDTADTGETQQTQGRHSRHRGDTADTGETLIFNLDPRP